MYTKRSHVRASFGRSPGDSGGDVANGVRVDTCPAAREMVYAGVVPHSPGAKEFGMATESIDCTLGAIGRSVVPGSRLGPDDLDHASDPARHAVIIDRGGDRDDPRPVTRLVMVRV
ncbi:hypothetical protein GCM10023147_01870 [Tsukamurella soli]|uniref:Uncharacterized protein n=1 Tax=Tsukamurella soli TaxID=644556 RepID=A0ABP8J166_9ACTN